MSETKSNQSDTRVSFCKVINNETYNILYRLADIVNNQIFSFKPEYGTKEPPYGNTTIKGPNQGRDFGKKPGEYGVWEWSFSIKPGSNNPFYVSSLTTSYPIPIWYITGFDYLSDLGKHLLNKGIQKEPPCFSSLGDNSTILVGIFVDNSYRCFICSKRDITKKDGFYYLSKSVFRRPSCLVDKNDTLLLDGQPYYRYLNLLRSQKQDPVWIQNPYEAVRYVLSQHMTKSRLLEFEIIPTDTNREQTRLNVDRIKFFVERMGKNVLYQDYASIAIVSEDEAKQYFDDFLDNLTNTSEDIDWLGNFLLTAYDSLPKLRERFDHIYRSTWELDKRNDLDQKVNELQQQYNDDIESLKQQHNDTIESLNRQHKEKVDLLKHQHNETVESLKRQHNEVVDKLLKCSKEYERVEKQLERVKSELKQATVTRDAIFSELQDARENTAAFVKNVFPVWALSCFSPKPVVVQQPAPLILPEITVEDYTDLAMTLSKIKTNLKTAGVIKRYRDTTTRILYSSYLKRLPLFFAGPNGDVLADAFAAALEGNNAWRLDGTVPFSRGLLHELQECRDHVLLIQSPLSQDWSEHLQELAEMGIQVIATHPHPEDLRIAPKSLFSQCLPLFTELLIDSPPSRSFIYRDNSQPLEEPPKEKSFEDKDLYDGLLQFLGTSPYTRERLLSFLTRFKSLTDQQSDVDDDTDCFITIFPFCWLTARRKKDFLKKAFSDLNISEILKKELSSFTGIVNEQ